MQTPLLTPTSAAATPVASPATAAAHSGPAASSAPPQFGNGIFDQFKKAAPETAESPDKATPKASGDGRIKKSFKLGFGAFALSMVGGAALGLTGVGWLPGCFLIAASPLAGLAGGLVGLIKSPNK